MRKITRKLDRYVGSGCYKYSQRKGIGQLAANKTSPIPILENSYFSIEERSYPRSYYLKLPNATINPQNV